MQFPAIRLSVFEICLIQIVFYAGLWLIDEYIASYISIIFPVLILTILGITVVADLIEPSRISKKYFWIMLVSGLTPLVVGACFVFLYRGRLDWLDGI